MAQPPIRDNISEMSPLLKPRYKKRIDPFGMKALKGFRHHTGVAGTRPIYRTPKRAVRGPR